MKKIILITLFVSIKLFSGVTGLIEGVVKDQKTKEPIIGATIILEGTKLGATTNQRGYFLIQNITIGKYDLKISMLGYATVLLKDLKVLPDFSTKISIELKESDIELAPIVIKAEQDLIQRDQAATIFHINPQKIEMLPITKIEEIISLQPGTTIEGNIRGGKILDALYLIDGVSARDMIGGGTGFEIPKNAISGISIFTGGFDAEYGNAQSGVINIITKQGKNEFGINARVESDAWIAREFNKQQNGYSLIELTAFGPIIKDELNYFVDQNISASNTRWWQDFQNFFPTPIEKELNGIFRLDYSPNVLQKISFQNIYSTKNWRDYEFSWRYNLDGLPSRAQNSFRTLLTYTYTISTETIFNINFSGRFQNSKISEGEKNNVKANPYEYDFFLQYIVDGNRSWWASSEQNIYTIKSDVVSFVNEKHFLKFGGEVNFYNLKSDLIKYEPQKTYFGKPILNAPLLNYSNSYSYQPQTGNIFIQDKIEIKEDGSNLSFGLRWDYFNPKASRPIVEFIPTTEKEFEQKITGTKKISFKHQFSPRFSIAAPLGGDNFIFINYGHYFQLPLFDYLYSGITPSQIRFGVKNVQAGNPELDPERTTLWEIGLKREIFKGLIGSATYFKKKFLNQIDTKTLIPFDSKSSGDFGFATYVNNSEANSNGVELVLHKEFDGKVGGNFSYTFMMTEGLSEYVDQTLNYSQWGFPLITKPYPLSWDERQSIKTDIEFILPFEVESNFIFMFSSARPFTFYPTKDGFTPRDSGKVFLPNNKRMENLIFANIKLIKDFMIEVGGTKKIEIYLEGKNIFNKKNIRWIDSSGKIGGELSDPSAFYSPRRIIFGFKVDW